MCHSNQTTSTVNTSAVNKAVNTTVQPVNHLTYNVECSKCGSTVVNGSKCKRCGAKK
jgi:hypothetical protein